jgi:hypothetical protein
MEVEEICRKNAWKAECKGELATKYANAFCSKSSIQAQAAQEAKKSCAGAGTQQRACEASVKKGWLESNCLAPRRTRYQQVVCTQPTFDYREYLSHVSPKDGKIYPGLSTKDGNIPCASDPGVRVMVEAVYFYHPDTTWSGVRGLDGVQTIRNDKWVEVDHPYVPQWPQGQRGYKFVKVSKVNRTKHDGKDVLSAEAPGCKQPGLMQSGWWIIDPESSGIPGVDPARAKGLTRKDEIAYIRDSKNENNCEFIGRYISEATALRDVRSKGVLSPYFAAHPGWGSLDAVDVILAKQGPANALLYFMDPSQKLRDLRKEMRDARDRKQLLQEHKKQAASMSEALALDEAAMLLKARHSFPDMPLSVAMDMFRNPLPLCSVIQGIVKEQLALEKRNAEIEQDIQAIYAFRLKQLEEAGLLAPDPEEQTAQAGGSPLLKLAAVAAVGFIGFKFLTKR